MKTKYTKSYWFTKTYRDKMKKGMPKEIKKEIDRMWETYVGKPKRKLKELYEQQIKKS